MTTYAEYFLNSRASVIQYETLEITHPNFTQDFYIVRNALRGLTAVDENSNERDFEYYPLRIKRSRSSDDLDQVFKIDLGDVGKVVPIEVDSVAAADGFETKPTVVYRTYRSDDLTTPLYGPIQLEVPAFHLTAEGCSFEARAPQVNNLTTGERYTFDRFPMLKGVL